jgi:hydrogenase-4 component E
VAGTPLDVQLLNLCAALLLLLSFAMLAQRRIVNLVNLLAMQGSLLLVATLLLAWRTGQPHLYVSALLTLALKVVFLPWLLHRLIRRLQVYWDSEPLLNIPLTMLVGVIVVVFSWQSALWGTRARRPRRAALGTRAQCRGEPRHVCRRLRTHRARRGGRQCAHRS